MADIKLILGDCIEKMKDIPDNSIDMVMTSPPYDNLRDYGKDFTGWGEHIWKPVLEGIFRVLKDGGVCVWVVGDATINGSETGTSFRQALYWMEIGGKLYDTMIWNKNNCSSVGSMRRYENTFEYMFILSKGTPITTNIIKDKPNIRAGELQYGSIRQKDGVVRKTSQYGKRVIAEFGRRQNVWTIFPAKSSKERLHPAPFPEVLAKDHILSWSNENDIILDPFMGSGTTGIACHELGREFIGIELDEGYFKIAQTRIHDAQSQGVLL